MIKHYLLFYFFFTTTSITFLFGATNAERCVEISSQITDPTSTISGVKEICQNSSNNLITFNATGGSKPYTFTYSINNGADQTITSIGSDNFATVVVPSSDLGPKKYSIRSIKDSSVDAKEISQDVNYTTEVFAAPSVDFSFNNDNSCAGTSIQFQSVVSGSGLYTYSWDFGDGTAFSTLANPVHSYIATGCTTQKFTVKLTVFSNGCTVVSNKEVSVKQAPLINITDVNSPFAPFNNCGNASENSNYEIKVGNNGSSTCITEYSINWGDGNMQSGVSFPVTHSYTSTGVYNMVVTALGNEGCIGTKTYVIKNISNPLGGINSPGSTQNLCSPTQPLQFSISSWGKNSLDTTYSVDYGDNTPVKILTQQELIGSIYYNATKPELSLNYPIPHVYNGTSCPSSTLTVKLDVTNACGTTPFTLSNITILTKPKVDFSFTDKACVNSSVNFINTTVSGFQQSCDRTSIFTWDFGDGTPIITTGPYLPTDQIHKFLNPGTYTVTLTGQNYCGTDTKTQQICIENPLVPAFTLIKIGDCAPMAVTAINNTVETNSCTAASYLWTVTYSRASCGPVTVSIPNQTTKNATYNFTEPGTYTIRLTATNSCAGVSTSQTVEVKQPPTASINSIGNLCGAGSINPVAVVSSCTSSTTPLAYAWSFPGGSPATANTANPGSISYATAGNYTVSLVVSNECGNSTTATQSFLVLASPKITNTDFAQSICVGTTSLAINLIADVVGTTYSWTATATAGITGFVASGTGATIPSRTITTTNTTSGTVTYVVTPKNGICTGTPANFVITVNPAPTILTQPLPSNVCLNGIPTQLSVVVSASTVNPTYQWFSNSINSTMGGNLIVGAQAAIYDPPTTAVGTVYYYCVINLSSVVCAALSSSIASVTVSPAISITSQPVTTQGVCTGFALSSPLSVASTGGAGALTYQWYSNTNASNTGGTPLTGATSSTYTPPVFTSAGIYYYYVTVMRSANACGSETSTYAEVKVYDQPTITAQPISNQLLCSGDIPAVLTVLATSGNGAYSYQWYRNSVNNASSGSPIATATAASYQPTSTTGTTYYYCKVSQLTTFGCSVTSATSAVQFVTSPALNSQPASSTICLGGTATTLAFTISNGVGTANYQWFSNTTSSIIGGVAIAGATNASYAPPSTTIGNFYYYCVIKFPSLAGGCGLVVTTVANVIINPNPQISNTTTVTCSGTRFTITPSSTDVNVVPTGTTYTWTTPTISPLGSVTGATAQTVSQTRISQILTNVTTSPATVTYTVRPITGNCIGSNFTVIVTVNPAPTILTQPISSTVCLNGSPTQLSVVVSAAAVSPTYQWFSNNTDSSTAGILILGEETATYNPPTNAIGTVYYYCVISLPSGSCAALSSSIASVTVSPAISITTQPITTQGLCTGYTLSSPLSVASAGGAGNIIYQWYSNINPSNTNGMPLTGATSNTYTPPVFTSAGTYYYYVTITRSANGCGSETSAVAEVKVYDQPTITSQPISNQLLCSDDVPALLTVQAIRGNGAYTYQWYRNPVNNTVTGSAIATATAASYQPTITTGISYYYCKVSQLTTFGCSVTSATSAVQFATSPTLDSQPASSTICLGEAATTLSFTISNGLGAATYQWFTNTSSSTTGSVAVSGATNASYEPPGTAIGNFYYYCVINFPSLSGSCGKIVTTVANVIINPKAQIGNTTETTCSGIQFTIMPSTTEGDVVPTGTTYTWTTPTISPLGSVTGATAQTVSQSGISQVLTNSTSSPATVTYTVRPITGNCIGAGFTVIVTVNPAPTILTQPVPSTVCLDGRPTQLSVAVSAVAVNPTYQWFSNSTNSSVGGNLIVGAQTAIYDPPTTAVGTVYYYCVINLSSAGCAALSSSIASVTVSPAISITSQPVRTQGVCTGFTLSSPLSVVSTGGAGTQTYQWYSNTDASNTGGSPLTGATSSTYTPPVFTSAGTYYYYLTVTRSANGCGSETSAFAEVRVYDQPTITTQPISNQLLCSGDIPTLLTVQATSGNGTYTYQWYRNPNNNTVTGSAIATATAASYQPTITTGISYYYCKVSQLTTFGCSVTSETAMVQFATSPTLSSQPASSTICLGGTATTLAFTISNGVGTASYQWFSNTASSSTGGLAIAGATNASYAPPTATTGVFYYYCVINFPSLSGSCGKVVTTVANVIINPKAEIGNTTASTCSGTQFTITPSLTSGNIVPTGTTYTWTTPTISPLGSVTGATAQAVSQIGISQVLTNSTTSPATVTYTVRPITGNCIGADFNIVVTVNPLISTIETLVDNRCFGANTASISVNATGGIPFSTGAAYRYSWSGPSGFTATTNAISNLLPGTYSLTITDAGSCPFVKSYTIAAPTPIIIALQNQKNVSCFDGNDGALAVNVTGGSGAYTYAWTKNNLPFSTTKDISTLTMGVYQLTVTDTKNCTTQSILYSIQQPTLLTVALQSKTDILCFGAATGAIIIDVNGGSLGTSGYTFLWSGPNGFSASSQNLNNLPAGSYNVTVTDANNCSATIVVDLSQKTQIAITSSFTPILCYGDENGTINASISGGTGPYTYQWSNLATTLNQTNLGAGDYILTVTDANRCTFSKTITIPQVPVFSVNPIKKNISCFGAKDGSIAMNLTGGKAPVTLVWSDGSTAGLTRNNLAAGTYTATISDGTPCQIQRTFVIVEPQNLVVGSSVTNALDCDNAASGAIRLLISGGTAPFKYAWSNGATTRDLIAVLAGTYEVTVTDANGCTKEGQFSINRPVPLVANVTVKTDVDCETRTINQIYTAVVSGGVSPYQLNWSSGTVSGVNNEIMTTNQNGSVILTATDRLGCKTDHIFEVEVPLASVTAFTATSFAQTTFGTYSIEDPIQFTNTATGKYDSIVWDFGDNTFSNEPNPIHIYKTEGEYVVTQKISYPFGCVYINTLKIVVDKGYKLLSPNGFTPNNDGINDYFVPVFVGLNAIEFTVFDTWGSVIYTEKGENIRGWDGKIKDSLAENGNYYFKIVGKTFYGRTIKDQGAIVLIK